MKLLPFATAARADRPRRRWRALCAPRMRRLGIERLEDRHMLSAMPLGAMPDDTAEYMLGDVCVTLVLMESDGTLDANTEDWTAADIAAVEQTVAEGLTWWEDTLALEGSVHSLNFLLDTTYADSPVPTGYEPIARSWDAFSFWAEDFLDHVGFNTAADLGQDMLAFNHAQREVHGTDWAFTIFVANSTNDPDDRFELGHEFAGSFAFAGGLFFVTPSGRPASTIAHETGHIFYAKDEYPGGASYYDSRGYYDTQNLNAFDDHPDPDSRVDSIMSSGVELQNAYAGHLVSPSAKAMVGWADRDGDGVFDVLDVPLRLSGSGVLDPQTQAYRFLGQASAQTLPNLNPSGLRNDITLNEVSRVEFRFDGGDWQTAAQYRTPTATLDLTIPVPIGAIDIEIRAIDDASGVTSAIFHAAVGPAESTDSPGVGGFVWIDVDEDGLRETGEPGLGNWTVRLTQADGTPLVSPLSIEPDDFAPAVAIDHAVPGVTLSAEIIGGFSSSVGATPSAVASTGETVFAYQVGTAFNPLWTSESRRLRIDFASAVSRVRIDAVADSAGDCGRLEVYGHDGQLLARATSEVLAAGQFATLDIARPTADIAFALVGGHLDSEIELDHLRIGIDTVAQTDALGAFSFVGLEPGTYGVEVDLRWCWTNVLPQTGAATVVVGEDGTAAGVDFGVCPMSAGSLWQNPANPLDVNDDGAVAIGDVQWIAYDLYYNAPRRLPAPTVPPNVPAPYLDVNGDGFVTAVDALLVVRGLAGYSAVASSSLEQPVTLASDIPPEAPADVAANVAKVDIVPTAEEHATVGEAFAEGQAAGLTLGEAPSALPVLLAEALFDGNGTASGARPVRPPRATVEWGPSRADSAAVGVAVRRVAVSSGLETAHEPAACRDRLFADIATLEEILATGPGDAPLAIVLGNGVFSGAP